MNRNSRNSAIAAAIILVVFGLVAFYMPAIMTAVGNFSTILAGMVAAAFVAAFFLILWLRARSQRGG